MNKFVCVTILGLLQAFLINGQIFDPYEFHSAGRLSDEIYYGKATPCFYNINCTINSNILSGYQELDVNRYYNFNLSNIMFKINNTSCLPINIISTHDLIINYSFDNITWITSNHIIPKIGSIYININSVVSHIIGFYLLQDSRCISRNYSLIKRSIIGDTILEYNTSSSGLSIYIESDDSFRSVIYYDGFYNKNRYNYTAISLGVFMTQSGRDDNYTIKLYIYPKNKTANCSLNIYIDPYSEFVNYSSPILFYNNTQIFDYLILNDTYDINWNSNITLDGGNSAVTLSSLPIRIAPLTHLEVFNNINRFTVTPTYFDPLLRYFGIYSSSNLTINPDFNFTSDLTVNNSILNLSISMIPVSINLQDSLLIVSTNDLKIKSANLTGDNTLVLNNGTLLIDSVILSGTLKIQGSVDNGTVIMSYQNRTGIFDTVNITNSSSRCQNYTVDYSESRMTVLLVPSSCDKSTDSNMNLIIILICVGAVVLLVIIVAILLSIRKCRQKIFPHEDRSRVVVNNDSDVKKEDYKNRTLKSYRIPKTIG